MESDLVAHSKAARLDAYRGAVPLVLDEIQAMIAQLDARALDHVRKETLTPELAKDMWVEKAVLVALSKRLSTKSALGAA